LAWFFWSGFAQESKDSNGQLFGQWRNYFQTTFNKDELKNFRALATGGKMGYSYEKKAWKFQVVGYGSINLGLQDLTQPDVVTGKISRYEAGLFDVNDLSDRFIFLPGEAFVRYTKAGHSLRLGRMKLITPLINPEDGRMIPTLEQGFWYKYESPENWIFQLGILNAIAPRSTDRFEKIGESLGLYPVGRNVDGSPSGYKGNIDSDYVLMANVARNWNSGVEINIWNYYVDQVFNTTYTKLNWTEPDKKWGMGAEWIHQKKINHGGNQNDSLTYFFDVNSNVIGLELRYESANQLFKLGYNHILDGGRFLFPREWGRETLYTFQKRERSDGSANNHALLVTYQNDLKIGESSVRTILSLGHSWKPEVTNPADNKYALPSYRHVNIDWFFLHKKLPNFKPELLLTYKKGLGDIPNNPNFFINKVDLFQINCIINYSF
jgi:hypothetical protein